MRIVALAGGVGGAKLADGLARNLAPKELSVIVNTGDDFNHLGLRICPDLDTVCYTLAGLSNPVTGWGRVNDTRNGLTVIKELGGPEWFNLGDGDIGLSLVRTFRLNNGEPLSTIVRSFCTNWGIEIDVLPMSDDPIQTRIVIAEGSLLDFQEYFVHLQCQPMIKKIIFDGWDTARPSPGILNKIDEADFIILCPSNPWVSIDPILSIPGIRAKLEKKKIIAVSPIIGGTTIKGPAAKMYEEFGIKPSAVAVAQHYGKMLTGFVYDEKDKDLESEFSQQSIMTLRTNTIMTDGKTRKVLASEILEFCYQMS